MRALRFGLIVLIVLAVAAAAGLIVVKALRSLDEPLNVTAPLRFKVPPGARFARVAADLAARGVVQQPRAWVLYARWKGLAAAIKAGEYEIEPGATPKSLLEKLVSGQVVLHSFTIVDGWRVQDLLSALRRDPDVTVTLADPPHELMARLGAPGLDPEGQFLPETYRFPEGTADLEILRQAHAALVRELESAWAGRDPSVPLKSANELLIVASIVEKESALPEELPKIAGLYLHRLRIGMRLQADPTLIYGLGERYDGQLHSVDLRTDGPYNTYTRAGLPPTPIALAGAAAIRATAHPDNTEALYFVASPRDDGSHIFSATLQEQNAAVSRYVAHLRQKAAQAAK
ncbi:MAG TPA: endolytic transglycosylase MltG [Steroidobacteraceae bacterium]|nr:endolytic transglycosylase MltG [Steroidobacteraceae bacterium]